MPELSTRRCVPSRRRWPNDILVRPGVGRRSHAVGRKACSLRHGVRLAIDPGGTRVGVARSDPAGMLATPVRTLRRGAGDIKEIVALVEELDACEVIIGYPASLSGEEGPAARKARGYAGALASKLAVPVRLVDERLTTATAQAQLLQSAGHGGRGRRAGEQRRAVVDQAAATVLLQGALDTERRTGQPPGELVGSPLS